jgi:hypothetical protein
MEAQWVIDEEWLDWYKLSPEQRWAETKKLWDFYLSLGGELDPEPDSQSPFDTHFAQGALTPHGGTSMCDVRRS